MLTTKLWRPNDQGKLFRPKTRKIYEGTLYSFGCLYYVISGEDGIITYEWSLLNILLMEKPWKPDQGEIVFSVLISFLIQPQHKILKDFHLFLIENN